MEDPTSDESAGRVPDGRPRDIGSLDASVAVADPPPSMSAAHWANRDNETLYRRTGPTGTFRRPPAENSFPERSTPVAEFAYRPVDAAAPAPAFRPPEPRRPPDARPLDSRAPVDQLGGADQHGASAPEISARQWSGAGETGTAGPVPDPRSDPGQSALPGSFGSPPVPHSDPSGSWATRRAGAQPGGAPLGPGRPAWPGPPGAAKARAARLPKPGRTPKPDLESTPDHPSKPEPRTKKRSNGAPDSSDMTSILGGPGRDIRAHRAGRREGPSAGLPGRGTATDVQPVRRPSAALRWLTLTLSSVFLAGAGVAGWAYYYGTPTAVASMLPSRTTAATTTTTTTTTTAAAAAQRTVTAPLSGRADAEFELVTGTTEVRLRSEDLGDNLYRITTAPDAGSVPRPVLDGKRVQLHLAATGEGAGGSVEIVLSTKVRWALRFTGGAEEQRIDMSKGQVGAVDIAGGATRFELSLPQASGTVGVRLAGAVEEFVLTAPEASPVRVQVDSGAKTVAAGNLTRRDVEPGSTFTPEGWQTTNRYDVNAASRVTLLSVRSVG